MATFNGQLRSNEIFSALYNMIISQQVAADNIAGTFSKLVSEAKVDGGLAGDTKLYYATDALKSVPWGNDAEAANLLQLHRPAAPKCQAIVLDTFRQIPLTVDEYLSKRAWADESSFNSFNSVMLGWIRDTKKIYDSTTYNAFLGTCEGEATRSTVSVPLSDIESTGVEKSQEEGMMIAEAIANLLVEMEDVSRDFNDYGFLRSYDVSQIKIIWNSKFLNKIKKVSLPTIFHKEGLIEKLGDYVLPEKYFGEIDTVGGTTSSSVKRRALVEKDYTVQGRTTHCFPGMEIPTGATFAANEAYTNDEDVICKIVTKLPPFMSAFEVGTTFFNQKSLTENHYLTWGHNTLEHLKDCPMITLHAD